MKLHSKNGQVIQEQIKDAENSGVTEALFQLPCAYSDTLL